MGMMQTRLHVLHRKNGELIFLVRGPATCDRIAELEAPTIFSKLVADIVARAHA